MKLKDWPIGQGYRTIEVDPDRKKKFGDMFLEALPSWDHGVPVGVAVHRQGNPGAKALNAIRWGVDNRAFSIHDYIGDDTVYVCVPFNMHAYHILEWREAFEHGRPVYRNTFWANVPKNLTAQPLPGSQYAGRSVPRGDIGIYGIECEDHLLPDGKTAIFTQKTRQTLVLRVRDVIVRMARARGEYVRDTPLLITGHQTWDQWTRPDDPGTALNLLDFYADVADLLAGREPWRTTGPGYDGRELMKDRDLVEALDLTAETRMAEDILKKANELAKSLRSK